MYGLFLFTSNIPDEEKNEKYLQNLTSFESFL